MAVHFEQIRENYKRAVEGSNPDPHTLAQWICEEVGLTDSNGNYFDRGDGFPRLNPDRKKRVADFPLRHLAEAVVGRDWTTVLGLDSSGSAFPLRRLARVQEEAFAPIGPSHLFNVSAWSSAVGGLIQASLLEGYETSDFDLVDLFPTRPVTFWNGGERFVDIIGPSKPAPKVGVGEPHPDVRVDGVWVEPAALNKYGHKVTVAKETAFVDITGGQVLSRAKNLGYGLKYRENELILDIITGVTNNFKLGLTADSSATGYNTYGATVPTGNGTTGTLGNTITNPMTDPLTTFNLSQESLLGYKHPVTGLPMPVASKLTTLLIPSNLQWFATYLTSIGQLTVGSQPGSPAPQIASSTFPTGWITGPNPFGGLFNQVRVSQWLYEKHTRSTTQTDPDISPGLGLSTDNSRRWYRLDPQKFAARRAAWEMNIIELNPNDAMMADQGIIGGAVGNIAVQFQVLSPWHIQRNVVA